MKILVIEDEYLCRLSLTSLLNQYGDVGEAADGNEGLAAVNAALEASDPYDIVFMDIRMPGMSGLETSKKIRSLERQYSIAPRDEAKIIMATALHDVRTVFHALNKAQATAFLPKPCDAASVRKILAEMDIHPRANDVGCDPVIVEEFVLESSECLDQATDDVLLLEQGPNQEAIDRLFRVIHTIKGTAGMLTFRGVSDFVHEFENVCSEIRSGKCVLDKTMTDNILSCLDFIQSKLEFIRENHREDMNFSIGERYMDLLGRQISCPRIAA
ncbi:response regulator [uncultured Pseudodesulfovibrio sp.]|uniref:response regulator n=1 Tax=uncultured Pseudodesulfovibrio sp. TaxID=2035858 RepID=UPI0029C6CA1B|nr:response regulator [uncultured Pseudodesulfovibrio sp.]